MRAAVAASALVLLLSPALSSQTGLTGAPQLARVYDAIHDAKFDQVPTLLTQACGPAPDEACALLDIMSLWWQIQIDPHNRARDAEFQVKADAVIAAMEAWVGREPDRAEAWFYLGGSYGARAQWRVLRGEQLAAARDGKRIKEALERALALDAELDDAYFGIGLYHYYADVAPRAVRMLRWLLALPGGDRTQGLEEMLKARSGGELIRSEADYQLHGIYLWYEKQPERALELMSALAARHPTNPHFFERIAVIEDVYLHDPAASLRTWESLLDAARRRRVADPAMAEVIARLGIAMQRDRLFETDAAVDHLRAVIDDRPGVPFGALSLAHLRLGRALDRLGYRSDAVAAYRAALADAPAPDPLDIRDAARAGLRTTPDPKRTSAYRLSLEGWRALERGDMAQAASALAQSLALLPDDPVTQYRQAHLLLAQQLHDEALVVFAAIHKRPETTPAEIYLRACIDAARVHEQQGTITIAVDLYRTATNIFGGDRRLKESARRALTRLGI